ncbi:MAG: Hsp20/alpha crystallin family protein [Ignavibacteriae bacterium]|nr:Hsp20/alpha crystallin family protein [Ignavibacteriota bacterium]
MLVRFNNHTDSLLDTVFNNFFRGDVLDDGTFGLSHWTPAVDITEKENEYLVNVELPGINKDDVKIMVENNVLTIRGERKQDQETKQDGYRRVERSYGAFQRSFKLPNTVKAEKIDASYKDGVLTVTLPKAEEAKPKQIEVKVK